MTDNICLTKTPFGPKYARIDRATLITLLRRGAGKSRAIAAALLDDGLDPDAELQLAADGQELIDWLTGSCYREVREAIEHGAHEED